MLYLFILSLCLLVQQGLCQDKSVIAIIKECQQDYKVSTDQLKSILQLKTIPPEENVKCMLSCWSEKTNVITENNEIIAPNAMNVIQRIFTATEVQAKALDIFTTCSKRVYSPTSNYKPEDKCHKAYLLHTCFLEMAKESNLLNDILEQINKKRIKLQLVGTAN